MKKLLQRVRNIFQRRRQVQRQWISAKDKVSQDFIAVLCVTDEGNIRRGYFDVSLQEWFSFENSHIIKVDYWMPIPQVPKHKTKDIIQNRKPVCEFKNEDDYGWSLVTPWISISDRLPEKDEHILVGCRDDNGNLVYGWWRGYLLHEEAKKSDNDFKYWLPIPELPKDK